MSKRLTLEEWSDDHIDGYEDSHGLITTLFKRQKRESLFNNNNNNNNIDINNSIEVLDKSSKSGNNIISRVVRGVSTGFTNIMNNIKDYKIFKTRTNCNEMLENNVIDRHESQVRPRGMQSMTNSMNTTHNNVQQNSYKIVNCNVINNNCNYVLINQPIHQSIHPIISIIPAQTYTISNTSPNSPNPLVLCPNQNQLKVDKHKCGHCGQMASSPSRGVCGHCGLKRMAQNQHPIHSSPQTIAVNQFYNNNKSTSRSLPTICSPDVKPMARLFKTLSPTIQTNTRLCQMNLNHNPKPECIDLDVDKDVLTLKTKDCYSSNEECIEIQDMNASDEALNEKGIQCNDVVVEDYNQTDPQLQQSVSSVKTCDDSNKTMTSNLSINKTRSDFKEYTDYPEYVMFGTYRSNAKTMEFNLDGIKFTNVSPNNMETKFKYHIMIPFIEMKELNYCSHSLLTTIFVKPTKESNDKIQECMYLGNDSANGLRFDINSKEIKEHYIIAVMKSPFSDKFVEDLERCVRNHNPDIDYKRLNIDSAKYLLQRVQSRTSNIGNSERRFEQTILSANAIKSPIHRMSSIRTTPNPFAVNANRSQLGLGKEILLSPTPSPTKKWSVRSPRRLSSFHSPVETVIQIDDDDDEEDNGSKTQNDDEFNKVILTYPEDEENAIHISGNDIYCLNKGEFLNDNIVNFYLRHYYKRISDEERKRTHIFDTLFFLQLTEKRPTKRKNSSGREEQYTFEQRYNQKLKKWTKNVDIFSKDFLIFPIIKESHWFLAIVCNPNNINEVFLKLDKNNKKEELETEKRPCIIFMDSLGNASYKKQLSNPIREFLTLEWNEKKGSDEKISFKSKVSMRDFFPRVPNQTNSSDCGLFVLEYIEQFLSNPEYLLKKVFKDSKKALIDWFPIAEAKNKRFRIRAIILQLIPEEVAEKLSVLIKDEKESDEELNKDEIGMEVDNYSDPEFDNNSIQELKLEDMRKHNTRSATSKSNQLSETTETTNQTDSNTIDLVENIDEVIVKQLTNASSEIETNSSPNSNPTQQLSE